MTALAVSLADIISAHHVMHRLVTNLIWILVSCTNLCPQQVDSILLGLSKQDAVNLPYIASMGVYVFKTNMLLKLLRWSYPSCNDCGSEIIPSAVANHNVQAYLFNDHWEDIGTIKSFFDTNLALTEQPRKFEFYDLQTPFYTSPRFLPPSKIVDAIISHGCFLQECSIEHSIVGVHSHLGTPRICILTFRR